MPSCLTAIVIEQGTIMQRTDEITNDDHVRGPQDAALTVIEYGDFQCPYCARAHAALTELGKEMNLRLVFRHLPLGDLHPLAELAAEAAEAAAAQDRFWPMHDLLYEQQRQVFDPQDLAVLAGSLDLDIGRFREDLREHRHRTRVQRDLEDARSQGLHVTPSLFINGRHYRGDSDRASLERALKDA
jgi:protein-disulfide isomerase